MRLLDFVDRYAPRRPITESPQGEAEAKPVASPAIGVTATAVELADRFDGETEASKLSAGEVAAPVR